MPRNIIFECNKLHGFLRMNEFSDKNIAPCVRSKVIDSNTDINCIPDDFYTIKIVKENTSNCLFNNRDCDICENFECLYKDFGLEIIKKIRKEDFATWINQKLKVDKEFIFYFYKYFEADLFGKLIVGNDYYTIESVRGDNPNDYLESNTIWQKEGIINPMESFSDSQIAELIFYGKTIKEKMNLYIKSGYSIVMDFAYTKKNYFNNEKFKEINLLFYGLRTAYNRTDLQKIYYHVDKT